MRNLFDDALAQQLGLGHLTDSDRQLLCTSFDAKFYAECNPDLCVQDIEPFVHYMTIGWRECRDPSRHFQTLNYLLEHRDVLRSGSNPFVHWILGEHHDQPRTSLAEATGDSHGLEAQVPAGAEPGNLDAPWTSEIEKVVQVSADWSSVPAASARPSGCENLSAKDIERLRDAFDVKYYLERNLDVRRAGVDPFQHFMTLGWHEGRDPNPTFSTNFYQSYYPDIRGSGMNPFIHWVLHGVNERRAGMSFRQRLSLLHYNPTVSAIIPNYNHAAFLAERIESILNQTYKNIDIIILDDCSTDSSREVIQNYVDKYPDKIKAVFNSKNSGGVFYQWKMGIAETDSDLIWICESDDFCEPDFVEKLIPHFRDDSVQIAFGRILHTDGDGISNFGLDEYRESAERGVWDQSLVRPAASWFSRAFGVRNVIANVGGCIWRRGTIRPSVWEEACTYSVVGDWYLYLQIAVGGQIAWEPKAVSYFRVHGANTSSLSFTKPAFYHELERLMVELRTAWDIPTETVQKFYGHIVPQYDWFEVSKEYGELDRYCSLSRLLSVRRSRPHVLLAMHGFVPGGGEFFPIALANGLIKAGWTVSMLTFDTSEINMHMRESLDSAVSVYDAAWVVEYGTDRFLRDAQVSIVHSHTVGAEIHFFHFWRVVSDLQYLVTLHGSYEASHLSDEILETISTPVDHFIYTANKNLLPLAKLDIPESRFTKLPNAMPIDPEPFPKTRAQMGIAEDAIVFTLVARGIKRKGWRAAIEAFIKCRDRHPDLPMHLCLVGEGDEPDRYKGKYGQDPDICFLGYQSRINGLYRISDVAIVPTRFSGESFPLCIIQALQVGTPVIGTDVGEIRRMLIGSDGVEGGLVIEAPRDTKKFISSVASAMEMMLDDRLRHRLAEGAQELGREYDMERLVETYGQIYNRLLASGDENEVGPLNPQLAAADSRLSAR